MRSSAGMQAGFIPYPSINWFFEKKLGMSGEWLIFHEDLMMDWDRIYLNHQAEVREKKRKDQPKKPVNLPRKSRK